MQKRKVFISKAIILVFVGVVMSGIILVDAAKAAKPAPLTVDLVLPSSVSYGQTFNISINVKNMTSNPITINKVAVGYAIEMLRFKGPYEVSFNPVNVLANGTASFTVQYKLLTGPGTVVGMVVILANDAYDQAGFLGNAFGGVRVN
jgi:hypothetical protein